MIELKVLPKGPLYGEFEDRDGQKCSIQESTWQNEACIWLGMETPLDSQDVSDRMHHRMHLTQTQVHALLPLLRHFARTGTLGYDDPKEVFRVGVWVVGIGETNHGVEGRIVSISRGAQAIIQDYRQSGSEGQHICSWDRVDLMWEPIESPEDIPSRYDRLLEDDL